MRWSITDEQIEKFAKLIINECIMAIDDGNGEASSISEHAWRTRCQTEIKKYFGVE